MKPFPIAVRDDGFSPLYVITPPCTPEKLCRKCVDHLAGIAHIREIGTGVGFAMNFKTRRGDLMGQDVTGWGVPEDILRALCENPGSAEHVAAVCADYNRRYQPARRPGDLRAIANIHYLLQRGLSPFGVQARRAHELGMRVWARFELRQGRPACLAGHDEYLIPGRGDLDFRHEAVRALFLDIAQDMIDEGADGVSIDFCVYPPFFENPERDGHFMTRLLSDMRARFSGMGRKIDIVARLPRHPEHYGLLWRDWVRENVVDVLIPSVILPGELFDVPIDEYVRATRGTPVRVFGCMRPKLTSIDPDPQPNDESRGVWRFNRPNTEENDAARAALLLSSGADGLQIGLGTAFSYDPSRIPGTNPYTDAWQPYYAVYTRPELLRFADKTYPLVDVDFLPRAFQSSGSTLRIPFRISDEPAEAKRNNMRVSAFVCPTMRALAPGERLLIALNGCAPVCADSETLRGDMRPPIVFDHNRALVSGTNTFGSGWWLRGRKEIAVDPLQLRRADNFIDLTYVGAASLDLMDVDVSLRYACDYPAGNLSGILAALEPYTGRRIENRLAGPRADAFRLNGALMSANYAENVDAALLDQQILLCPATMDALYDDAWRQTRYVPGTRKDLEETVRRIVQGIDSRTGQVIAIMNFCRDLSDRSGGRILFYGGTEEELIKKGEQLCECCARLMTALCEIAGIPARIITHTVAGHLVCEAYAGHGWGYFDPRTGFYCVKPDGEPASLRELLDNPDLIDSQPEAVRANVSPRWTWAARAKRCKELFLNPYEVSTIKPYSLLDSGHYRYNWTTNRDLAQSRISEISRACTLASDAVFGLRSEPAHPALALTLPDECVLSAPVPVLALPRGLTVPPCAVRFSIDGSAVWTTPAIVSPENVHICMEGAFPLYGEGGALDPASLSEGRHTLCACDASDESVCARVHFTVRRA